MKKGVVSFGDAFLDYIATDSSNQKFRIFPGGTTLNVAVAVRKLGANPVYYLTKLGTDLKSKWIKTFLEEQKINLDFVRQSEKKQISRVYVHLDETGNRHFHSYVNESEDEYLERCELKEKLFQDAAIFYFGSGTLFHPKAFATTKEALQLAKRHNCITAFDPNIRLKRWKSAEECRKTVLEFLPKADILKLSKEELFFLTEKESLDACLQDIKKYKIPYLWVSLGEEGAVAVSRERKMVLPGESVKAIDTTGAGDIFMAALLEQIHDGGFPDTEEKLFQYTKKALKLGALTVTKTGALTAILEGKITYLEEKNSF